MAFPVVVDCLFFAFWNLCRVSVIVILGAVVVGSVAVWLGGFT